MIIDKIELLSMTPSDWPVVAAIYQQGLDSGNASFTSQAPASWEEWSAHKLTDCRLVARLEGEVVGWAAFSPVFSRPVYRGVVELSIYVSERAQRRGVGSALMQAMIRESEEHGIWTIQSRVFPENEGSVKLHLKNGFKLMCVHEKLGYMSFGPFTGQWRDVILFERRSKTAGVSKND
jgi:L-amino acid N-acyltransferase YncA